MDEPEDKLVFNCTYLHVNQTSDAVAPLINGHLQ